MDGYRRVTTDYIAQEGAVRVSSARPVVSNRTHV